MALAPEVRQYLEAFIIEAEESIAQINSCLKALGTQGAKLAVVEEAARATANLKNAAATMGFSSIRDLAHATWDMLDAWRRGGVKDPAVSLALLTQSHKQIRELLSALKDGKGVKADTGDLLLQLRALVSPDAENPWPEAEPPAARVLAEQRFIVHLTLESSCGHPAGRFLVCQGYLLGLGRVLAADPPPVVNQNDADFHLRFLLATTKNVADVRQIAASIPHVIKIEVVPATPEINTLPPIRTRKRPVFQGWNLYIESRLLDDLEELSAELAQIRSAYRALEHELQAGNPGLAFRLSRLGDRLEFPLRRLAEFSTQLRQIPAEHLLGKLVRPALEQGKEQGKELHVKILGPEVTLGLDQAERLIGPFQQLVGILIDECAQTPQERMQGGKTRVNRLELAAQKGETKTTLSLSIDGRGMDLEAAFKEGGCLYEMRRQLEAIGGSLDGQTWPDQGTLLAVEISLPGERVSVLAFGLGEDLCALPLQTVAEARRSVEDSVVKISGRNYIKQKRDMIPLFDLGGLLGKETEAKGGFWLFIQGADGRFVLQVPSILGPRQVVVKSGASGWRLPGAACQDETGRVYFLLSVDHLFKLAGGNRQANKTVREVKK